MSFWWAHQSSSGGAGSLVPLTQAHYLGASTPGALNTARRLTYGIEWTGAAENRFSAEFLERDKASIEQTNHSFS
jgi:hypothetical protein